MLLSLSAPVTNLELLVVALIVLFGFFGLLMLSRRTATAQVEEIEYENAGSYKWLRKSALYLLVLAFVVAYPFTQPFISFLTGLFMGAQPQATDSLGNVSDATVAAGQLAGGGVQLGTFFTKLWITIVFYLLFSGLPWLIQALTHPAPTAWAKTQYKDDFTSLSAPDKFAAYGRLQFINTAKIVGAALAAALLV